MWNKNYILKVGFILKTFYLQFLEGFLKLWELTAKVRKILLQAWFRELPQGVLDVLTPEQVLECHTEDETVALVKLLPPTQAALLDWAINLMADVVQEEAVNKMNARNIAMVFAPNMTQVIASLHNSRCTAFSCKSIVQRENCCYNEWSHSLTLCELFFCTDGRSLDRIDACGASYEFTEDAHLTDSEGQTRSSIRATTRCNGARDFGRGWTGQWL